MQATLDQSASIGGGAWLGWIAMRLLTSAPNVVVATVWADLLGQAGIAVTVQRAFAGSIVGGIPPDQALPEVWLVNDAELDEAANLLHQLRRLPHRRWVCLACDEMVDGPYEQCWNCGHMRVDA